MCICCALWCVPLLQARYSLIDGRCAHNCGALLQQQAMCGVPSSAELILDWLRQVAAQSGGNALLCNNILQCGTCSAL